ncbi:3D domain-containing protein [Clostridium drakei]|uniref:G5 domain-containing protein n=1 Tax=Clostridium drakei TaxID=332101 RepID=A0A2U8DXY6_9CLOT|nr:3D domain-containing protein [Clostridium drakei]AWI07576.1 hypothetical protein B9W14_25085 [Clostridium drakei]
MVEKLKGYLKKYFSNGPKAMYIYLTLIVLIVCVVLISSARKTITVSIDGKDKKIMTLSSTYRSALSNNGITVGPKDKTTVSLDNKVENDSKISIKRAVNVQVAVDGKKLDIKSAEDNIEKMLQAEKITIHQSDKIYPKKDSTVKEGLMIVVTRVETKDIKEVKPLDYNTVVKKDEDIEQGNNKVVQEGKAGEKETLTRVVYENGKEISRKVISETVKKQPVQKIIAMGALNVYTPSRGTRIPYTTAMRMRATGYTSDYESTGKSPGDPYFGITATGTVAKRSVGSYSSVAVDPRVIPLGTKLYIEGYGYAIAEDTGGAIKGDRVDLFFDSNSEANNWGVRWVNVYLVK